MENKYSSKYSPRFVAVLDVLGFKNKLLKLGAKNFALQYAKLIDELKEITKWEIKHVVFSDTILLYDERIGLNRSDDIMFKEIRGDNFLNYIAYIMRFALKIGFPLRGGIAFGDCYIDTTSNIYVGQPIVDAYITEEAQDWIGVALHDSCFSQFDSEYCSTSYEKIFSRVLAWDIPVKECVRDSSALRYTVNWFQDVDDAIQRELTNPENASHLERWIRLAELRKHISEHET